MIKLRWNKKYRLLSQIALSLLFTLFLVTQANASTPTTFNYTGADQTFIAPFTCNYLLETWGAQGWDFVYTGSISGGKPGGYGGYSRGTVFINEGTALNIRVGQQGQTLLSVTSEDSSNAYPNGGRGYSYQYMAYWVNQGGGGGSTDVSLNGVKQVVGGGGGGQCEFSIDNTSNLGGNNTGLMSTEYGYNGDGIGWYGSGGGGGYYGGQEHQGGSSYTCDNQNGVTTPGIQLGNGHATITLLTCTVGVATAGTGSGTAYGATVVNSGLSTTLTASPTAGSTFVNWTNNIGNPVVNDQSFITPVITSNVIYTANFTPTLPSTPANLQSAAVDSVSATISWYPSTSTDMYEIYMNGIFIGTTSNTSYTTSTLCNNTSYLFTVSAHNANGNSVLSQSLQINTPDSQVITGQKTRMILVSPDGTQYYDTKTKTTQQVNLPKITDQPGLNETLTKTFIVSKQ